MFNLFLDFLSAFTSANLYHSFFSDVWFSFDRPCIPGSYSDTDKAIICKDCVIGRYRPSQIEVNGVMTDTELTKCK